MVRALATDTERYELVEGVRLPPGTRNLHLDYTALDYTYPERLRFRYRLDGSDSDWVEAGTRRQAFYSNLGPGPYRFAVDVTDELGRWQDRATTVSFSIAPTFVQTRLFVVLCLLTAIALFGLLYRTRVRQLTARERILGETRLRERERIARELHDTLLQGTQALVYKVESAAKLSRNGTLPHDVLEQALAHADAVIAEGRDRIQELRIVQDAGPNLCTSLCQVGDALQRNHGGAFRAEIEGAVRRLTTVVHDEAYQIGREALLNAFQHARATSIECQLVFGDDAFRLRVRDDGVGFDSATLQSGARAGHWGLQGLRERAEAIGATCDVWSQVGAGTEVELRVPARLAYRDLGRRSWLPRFRLNPAGRHG